MPFLSLSLSLSLSHKHQPSLSTSAKIEFAICRMIGRLPDELAADVLFYDAFSIVTSAKNPLTRRRKLRLADLANEPWTLLPFDSFFGSVIAEAFRAQATP